jgi:hypothetical protein
VLILAPGAHRSRCKGFVSLTCRRSLTRDGIVNFSETTARNFLSDAIRVCDANAALPERVQSLDKKTVDC